MNALIEEVVSQTINKYVNENYSERKTINENDGDDMGIYKELDDKVIHICYSHNFNVQTRVGNDRAYYAFFMHCGFRGQTLYSCLFFVTLRQSREVTGTRKTKQTSLFCPSLVFS